MAASPSPSHDEAGTTLIEILIALVILGTAVVALLGGMGTSIKTSVLHRTQASAQVRLTDAAEALKDNAQHPYKECGGVIAPDYTDPAPAGGWTIDYQLNTTSGAPFQCDSADDTVQLIDVTVTYTDGTTESVSVVKRKP